jgi:hypothetical protein
VLYSDVCHSERHFKDIIFGISTCLVRIKFRTLSVLDFYANHSDGQGSSHWSWISSGALVQPLSQWKIHDVLLIVCVCVCIISYLACNVYAPQCHLRHALLYNIFPHHLINGMRFRKKVTEHKMCFNFL